jgi:hypothetical protein
MSLIVGRTHISLDQIRSFKEHPGLMRLNMLTFSFSAAVLFSVAMPLQAADLNLPGSTLGGQVANGVQPVINEQNAMAVVVSPPCPWEGYTLAQLMAYARIHDLVAYRNAQLSRRAGATEEEVREQLGNDLCS